MRMRMAEERNFAVAQTVADLASELGRTMAQVALNWVAARAGRHRTDPRARAPSHRSRTTSGRWAGVSTPTPAGASTTPAPSSAGYPYDFIDWIHSR